ncbi:S24 family peptidase [Helicobacter pullorum]|uniref:S24 family peptidase n=1 Tax=Helicobacter pullorum TaxID=35818 RepID=UPI000CF0659A|nr:S24 family peptidase [Helicobacter pullorum]
MKEKDKAILEEMKKFFNVDSATQVALKLGYRETTINNWHNKGISQSAINKFNAIRYNSEKTIAKEQNGSYVNFRYFSNIYAAAGYGNTNIDEHYEVLRLDTRFVSDFLGLNTSIGYDIIKIFGNSMEPYLLDGQTAIIDFTKNSLERVKNTDVVVVSLDDELYCKRIKKQPLLDKFVLISENKDYEDMIITKENFERCKILGVVVCRIDIKMFLNKIESINNF